MSYWQQQAQRRITVAELARGGMSNREIARVLEINLQTVRSDLRAIEEAAR